ALRRIEENICAVRRPQQRAAEGIRKEADLARLAAGHRRYPDIAECAIAGAEVRHPFAIGRPGAETVGPERRPWEIAGGQHARLLRPQVVDAEFAGVTYERQKLSVRAEHRSGIGARAIAEARFLRGLEIVRIDLVLAVAVADVSHRS